MKFKSCQHSYYIIGLLCIYYLVAGFIYFTWNILDKYSVTGDEPHYLVIASGIQKYRSFELTRPYTDEFKNRTIYKEWRANASVIPDNGNTHAEYGKHGVFSDHNVGLPVLLAVPYWLGGTILSKIVMIILSGFILVILNSYLNFYKTKLSSKIKLLIIGAVSIAMPYLIASNQIYPDLLAGIIALFGIVFYLTDYQNKSMQELFFASMIISYLPWLHIKNMAPALILALLFIYGLFNLKKPLKYCLVFLLPFIGSLCLLAVYNWYAFGNIFGPYTGQALQVSGQAIMVLLGLHFDQSHGVFMQNPLLIIGLVFLFKFIKDNKAAGFALLALYFSFVIPNAMHPNMYGGASFVGRFNWSGAVVLLLPTVYGLVQIRNNSNKLFWSVIVLSVSLQLQYLYKVVFGNKFLSNPDVEIEKFSSWAPDSIRHLFPSFSNISWAGSFAPNIAVCFAFLIIIVSSVLITRFDKYKIKILAICGILFLILAGYILLNQDIKYFQPKLFFTAKELRSDVGILQNGCRKADKATGNMPGYLTYGPYSRLQKGTYLCTYNYSSSADKNKVVGSWDIVFYPEVLVMGWLTGTGGTATTVKAYFYVSSKDSNKDIECRTYFNGTANLQIENITIERVE